MGDWCNYTDDKTRFYLSNNRLEDNNNTLKL